ncbi:MAG: hypothetical protein QOH92_1459 [Chloroflexota bacterium]|jgi:hypothetical protein|nr:hypothetical protein [Chloroflexota bacterium]
MPLFLDRHDIPDGVRDEPVRLYGIRAQTVP